MLNRHANMLLNASRQALVLSAQGRPTCIQLSHSPGQDNLRKSVKVEHNSAR
jgi:hypothetical protein